MRTSIALAVVAFIAGEYMLLSGLDWRSVEWCLVFKACQFTWAGIALWNAMQGAPDKRWLKVAALSVALVGGAMNTAARMANGGRMPVFGGWPSGLLLEDHVAADAAVHHLLWLTDWINGASPGDLVISTGAVGCLIIARMWLTAAGVAIATIIIVVLV